MKLRSLLPALFASIFCLCLSQNASSSPLTISIPNGQWWDEVRQGNSNLATKLGLSVPTEHLKTLANVREKMIAQGMAGFTLGLLPSDEVNAYAKREGGHDLIIFTSGFLLRFGNDPDVLATTLGHEMAHHLLGHTKPPSKNGTNPLYMLTNHSHHHPVSHANSSINPNQDSYALAKQTLDNEHQADLLGMEWAIKAGFSACGSYRLAQGLEEIQNGVASKAHSKSHPSNLERMQISQKLEQLENRSTGCMVDMPQDKLLTAATEAPYSQAYEDLIY